MGSINLYARIVPIFDCCGRVEYVTSPDRQEHLMATYGTAEMPDFWQHLSYDCQVAFRESGGSKQNKDGTETRACEAREIHVQLPNSALEKMTADQLAKKIANDFKSKYGVECLVGVHFNKAENNLHFHILFSERSLLPDPIIRIADRNAFIGADGIRKRTKKEILDAEGNLLPGCSIVKKGEVLSARYFGNKYAEFAEDSWLDDYKKHMAEWINENLEPDKKRTVFDPNGPYLAQKKIPKGTPPETERKLREWNRLTKVFRDLVDNGSITEAEAKNIKTRIAISPDQTQELRAILAEIYREMYPDHPERAAWDRLAAKSGEALLSLKVVSRFEKQELRELYKEQGKARIQAIESDDFVERKIQEARVAKLDLQIEKKKEKLGMSDWQQKVREFGRLAGYKREEVDRMYEAAPYLTKAQWAEIWTNCKQIQNEYWADYRKRSASIAYDIDAAYKRRRQIKDVEWLLDPRNRRRSLLGALYAVMVLTRTGGSHLVDEEIDRLKKEQKQLRRDMQHFRAASGETVETLKTRGLDPQKYLDAVQNLQEVAEPIIQRQLTGAVLKRQQKIRDLTL